MRFFLQVLVIALLAYMLELLLPWWSIAVAAFIGGMVNSRANFLAGFFGIALLWYLYALMMDVTAAAPLTDRVAALFSMNRVLLMFLTAFIGGLVGGFAAMAGSGLRRTSRRSTDSRYYR